ncbi:MAG: SLBB domain-containing protein, partial [Verrucomicrobiota bacterium]
EISPEAATEPGLAGGAPRAAANANPKSERGLYQMDPRMLARYFPQFKGQLTQPAPSPSSAAAAAKVQSKLESIVLEEMPIEGLPLQEVLKVLARESRSRDPEKHGINYLISNVSEIDPAVTGLSGPNPAAAGASLNDLTIHFNLPLRNVRLKDVLDAIVRVAERPIKYSVHDFGVLFSPGPFYSAAGVGDPALGAPMLQVRTFRVDPGTFVASLETAFGIKISVPAPARGEEAVLPKAAQLRLKHAEEDLKTATKLFETGNIGSDEFTRAKQRVEMLRAELDDLKEDLKKRGVARPQVPSREVQKALRQLLVDLGVNMDVANKAVYYNDLTGMVMVRASVEDLELVQAAIETLGGTASAPGMPYGLPGGGVGRLPGMGTSDPGGAAGDFPGTGSKNGGGYGGLGESSDESTAGISSQLPLSRTVRGTGERTDAVIVLGQVSNPCRIELPSSVQWGVLDAIAEAGGFTKLAHTSRIEVTRKGSAQKFDLEALKVANDSTNKFILQSGDIVFVPERSF